MFAVESIAAVAVEEGDAVVEPDEAAVEFADNFAAERLVVGPDLLVVGIELELC